ncbi:hypothetical protein K438DRAFT_2010274 [Mycena galopus ATCC 62051]|nr:hypothetical protein K438DRAFT_2010274 [Mycena galopus ATCC 62051]
MPIHVRRAPSVIRIRVGEPRQSHTGSAKPRASYSQAVNPNSCLFMSLPNIHVATGFCLSSLTSTSARPPNVMVNSSVRPTCTTLFSIQQSAHDHTRVPERSSTAVPPRPPLETRPKSCPPVP